MGGAIQELRTRGKRLLKPFKFSGHGDTGQRMHWIPARIRCKSTMEQVKTSQILNVETAGEMVSQFDRSKQMKTKRQASTVAEVDLAAIPAVILLKSSDILDQFNKGRRSASNRTHGRYEIPRRDAGDLRRDIVQTCNRQMAESAVQAKREIDRGIRFRQPVRNPLRRMSDLLQEGLKHPERPAAPAVFVPVRCRSRAR
jgi:hypothetical protein